MDAIGAELESLASATLQRAAQRPGTASGHLLAATTALLPAESRARWREEWLADLQVLPTRRERARFAVQIVAGIGRLAVTLYQPGALLRQVFGAVLAAAVAASGLVAGGWRTAMAMAAAAAARQPRPAAADNVTVPAQDRGSGHDQPHRSQPVGWHRLGEQRQQRTVGSIVSVSSNFQLAANPRVKSCTDADAVAGLYKALYDPLPLLEDPPVRAPRVRSVLNRPGWVYREDCADTCT